MVHQYFTRTKTINDNSTRANQRRSIEPFSPTGVIHSRNIVQPSVVGTNEPLHEISMKSVDSVSQRGDTEENQEFKQMSKLS